MFDINKMREKVLMIADPSNPYTQADFDKEFGGPVTNTNTYKMSIKFANKSNNEDPAYATNGASGFDLRASLTEPITIRQHEREIVPTGLFFSLPDNMEMQIRPRSGLAAKSGITVLNSPGTIDADYRGEIKVILINHSEDRFIVNNGDRIAQGVIASVLAKNIIDLTRVDDISTDTERGAGGFGSTGSK